VTSSRIIFLKGGVYSLPISFIKIKGKCFTFWLIWVIFKGRLNVDEIKYEFFSVCGICLSFPKLSLTLAIDVELKNH